MIYRPEIECAARETIREHQLALLNELLAGALPHNRFYAGRYGDLKPPLDWSSFERLPFVGKADLVADQQTHPPLGQVATYAEHEYIAYHQTSGTTGRPLRVLDTAASWAWWRECWQYVYAGAGITSADRIFFAF